MAPVMFNLCDVTSKMPTNAAFLVRVSRKWLVSFHNRESGIRLVELVLMDQQATLYNQYIPEFDDQLEKGGLYAMMHFSVKANVGTWKPTSHPYRLYFTDSTKIKPQANDRHPMFPLTLYKFTSFTDVNNSPNTDGPDLIDIIGVYNPKEVITKPVVTDGPSTWNSFHLRDLDNKRLHYTLWDEYIDQFSSYLSTPRHEPVIVLLQLCRINKRWGDAKGLAMSFHVTKLLIDEHIPDIEEFRIRFLSMRASASQSSGQVSSLLGLSSDDGTKIGFTRPLTELSLCKEIRGCWFYGQISSILSWKSWAYLGCFDPTCFKKATKGNGEYVCAKCDTRFLEGVWRYSLRLRVKHGRSSADIMLWDGECQRLIGKSTGEFSDHIDMEKLAPISCPEDISRLVGRDLLFRVTAPCWVVARCIVLT